MSKFSYFISGKSLNHDHHQCHSNSRCADFDLTLWVERPETSLPDIKEDRQGRPWISQSVLYIGNLWMLYYKKTVILVSVRIKLDETYQCAAQIWYIAKKKSGCHCLWLGLFFFNFRVFPYINIIEDSKTLMLLKQGHLGEGLASSWADEVEPWDGRSLLFPDVHSQGKSQLYP